MMKLFRIFFVLSFALAVLPAVGRAEKLPPLPNGPLVLTSVKPEQLSPDYWTSRLPDPDKPLKTPEELKQLNEDIHLMLRDCVQVHKLSATRPGRPVRDQIELEYTTVAGRILYGVDDRRIPQGIFTEGIKPLLQWEKIPDKIKVQWGVATKAASVRALPSDVKMLEQKGDIEFDQLQFTLIKLWTPVAIYHKSSDGNWYYIQAPYTRGWVKAKDIAVFGAREEFLKYAKPKHFLVVTGESIPIFADAAFGKMLQRPSMGTVIPFGKRDGNAYVIPRPLRGIDGKLVLKKTYINAKSDVTSGFLPFTQRNVIRQAFKLLGARYGWGGMYNGRDCSAFTHDVFLTFGIDMPRASKDQAFVGTQISHFEYKEETEGKLAALRGATPAITLLRMPHHQMLYLGEVAGQFYAIHCTWAERISMTSDEKNRINQVVVSDLTLNGHSYLGSLFDRIISISEIN